MLWNSLGQSQQSLYSTLHAVFVYIHNSLCFGGKPSRRPPIGVSCPSDFSRYGTFLPTCGFLKVMSAQVPYHCRVYITATSPEHWNYVSEGAETIVFSYAGPPHPQFEGTVLRLKKTTARIFFPDRMIAFQHEVMERLIPPENLPRLGIVHLDKIWLEALAVLSECKRPQERRKCQMDVTVRTAILATNLVGNTALSVEIKVFLQFSDLRSVVTQLTAQMGLSSIFCPFIARYSSDQDSYMQILYALVSQIHKWRNRCF